MTDRNAASGAVANTGASRSATGAGRGSGERRNQGRGGRRFLPRHTSKSNKFEGSFDDLKGHIFDSEGYDQVNRFTKTLEQISNYVGRKYSHEGTMAIAVENLEQPKVMTPPPPDHYGNDAKCDKTAKHIWEQEIKEVILDKKEIGLLVAKLYALVIGQCTDTMVARITANNAYKKTMDERNGIDLLKIIKGICFNFEDQKCMQQSIFEAKMRFYNIVDRGDNH